MVVDNQAALCEAIELLPKRARKNIILIVLNNGYAAKDVAELMGVSISAVSRYTHDELAPSPFSLCRLLSLVDEKTKTQIINYVAEEIWTILRSILEETSASIVERIADDIARVILTKSRETSS